MTFETSFLTRLNCSWNVTTCCSIAMLIVRNLLFRGRPDGLEITLNQRAIVPWNVILIQQIFLRRTQIGFDIAVVQSRSLLLAGFFDVLGLLSTVLHSLDLFLLQLHVETRWCAFAGRVGAALSRRHQTIAVA